MTLGAYAECCIFVMLTVVMLSVRMLSVVILIVVESLECLALAPGISLVEYLQLQSWNTIKRESLSTIDHPSKLACFA